MSSSSATRHLMACGRPMSRQLERAVLRATGIEVADSAAAATRHHRPFGSVAAAAADVPVRSTSKLDALRLYHARPVVLGGIPRSGRNLSSEAGKANSAEEEAAAEEQEQQAETSDGAGTDAAKQDEAEVSREAELESQVKQLKDQILRGLAEQENIRKIAKRDVESARSFAVTSFAKSLLDTSDNLSRAMESVPPEYRDDTENHPVLATLFEGIKMTDENLLKAFEKNGLIKYGDVGEKFDPNMHEALFEYPDPNAEVGSIGQVMKAGFKLNERVIRPAEVGVIKKA